MKNLREQIVRNLRYFVDHPAEDLADRIVRLVIRELAVAVNELDPIGRTESDVIDEYLGYLGLHKYYAATTDGPAFVVAALPAKEEQA